MTRWRRKKSGWKFSVYQRGDGLGFKVRKPCGSWFEVYRRENGVIWYQPHSSVPDHVKQQIAATITLYSSGDVKIAQFPPSDWSRP